MTKPRYGVTFDTWCKLNTLAAEMLYKGIKDGGVQHEPDQFREQGYASQLVHVDDHIYSQRMRDASGIQDSEDHLAHALTRILFAELLRREAQHG